MNKYTKSRGKPIIGVGAGIGIIAKVAELAGADLIIIYNSGRTLLCFSSSNKISVRAVIHDMWVIHACSGSTEV
ncbi:MAG: phosphoenolpyruvate hydrolase family protein [Thermosphaera sp.]